MREFSPDFNVLGSVGHTSTQKPHLIQLPSSITGKIVSSSSPLTSFMAPGDGHEKTQAPQDMQSSFSTSGKSLNLEGVSAISGSVVASKISLNLFFPD